MAPTAKMECTLAAGVEEFLTHHHAEADFQHHLELVRSCFPDSQGIRVRMLDDPDDEDHTWVAFHLLLPRNYPPELLQDKRLRYYERLRALPPRPYHPLSFALTVDFTPE